MHSNQEYYLTQINIFFSPHFFLLICCVFQPVNACLCIWAHGQKWWKCLKIIKKVVLSSCACEAHVWLIQLHEEKSTLIVNFSSCLSVSFMWASHAHDEKSTFWWFSSVFLSFSTMEEHAQACISWLKYTTLIGGKMTSKLPPTG